MDFAHVNERTREKVARARGLSLGSGVNRAHRSLCSSGAIILNRPFIIARGSRGALINLPGTCRIIVKSKAKFRRGSARPGSAQSGATA